MSSNQTFLFEENNLFIEQSAKPDGLQEISLDQLTPFQRALLVTDGTVTQLIEAYILTPLEVIQLSQQKQVLSTKNLWLATHQGSTVVARKVIIQGMEPKSPVFYTYAESLIVHNRLPKVIQKGLEVGSEGLGKLLRRSGLETRRDLLWYGLEYTSNLPDILKHMAGKPFLSRTYRVIAKGEPIMLINERFPLTLALVH